MSLHDYTEMEVLNIKIGRVGATLITGNTLYSGNYSAITMLSDCTFSKLDSNNIDGDVLTTSVVFPKGITIYGAFTAIQLNSGSALAYKG